MSKYSPEDELGAPLAYFPPYVFAFCAHCGTQLKLTGGPEIDCTGVSLFAYPEHDCGYMKIEPRGKP